MKTLALLALFLFASCEVAAPVKSQTVLTPLYWYGDTANVVTSENTWYVDSMECELQPYSRLEFEARPNMNYVGFVGSLSDGVEIEITGEYQTHTIYVIGRLNGPLEYGVHTIPFQQPFNGVAKYISIELPLNKADVSENYGIAFIDAGICTLATDEVSVGKDSLTTQPTEFYNILGQRVPPSPIYKDLGNGRALVR